MTFNVPTLDQFKQETSEKIRQKAIADLESDERLKEQIKYNIVKNIKRIAQEEYKFQYKVPYIGLCYDHIYQHRCIEASPHFFGYWIKNEPRCKQLAKKCKYMVKEIIRTEFVQKKGYKYSDDTIYW